VPGGSAVNDAKRFVTGTPSRSSERDHAATPSGLVRSALRLASIATHVPLGTSRTVITVASATATASQTKYFR
jgi:hypothetical protein